MKENNIFEEENLNDFDDFDITDNDDLDWDFEDDLPSDSWDDEKKKNIVSYFEINGISGVMVFSDKGVEIRSLDPNKGISNIDAFTIIRCSKRVRQLLEDYKPDKSVQYSIVERISGDKSVTSFVKKQKVNKNICDFPVYDISEYGKYEKGGVYQISHVRYFFTIDALFIARQCAGSYWAGLAEYNRKSLLKEIKKYKGFRYVRHLDIREYCIDFM